MFKPTYTPDEHIAPKHLVKGTALKFDQEKNRVDLLDPLALEGLAKVLTFGAKKYAAHNWRSGFAWSRLIGAALRHLFAIMRGEDIDPESGLPHVDHLGCCWMFLSWHMKTNAGTDDRWTPLEGYPVDRRLSALGELRTEVEMEQ